MEYKKIKSIFWIRFNVHEIYKEEIFAYNQMYTGV